MYRKGVLYTKRMWTEDRVEITNSQDQEDDYFNDLYAPLGSRQHGTTLCESPRWSFDRHRYYRLDGRRLCSTACPATVITVIILLPSDPTRLFQPSAHQDEKIERDADYHKIKLSGRYWWNNPIRYSKTRTWRSMGKVLASYQYLSDTYITSPPRRWGASQVDRKSQLIWGFDVRWSWNLIKATPVVPPLVSAGCSFGSL